MPAAPGAYAGGGSTYSGNAGPQSWVADPPPAAAAAWGTPSAPAVQPDPPPPPPPAGAPQPQRATPPKDTTTGMYVIWQVEGDYPDTWIDYDVEFMNVLEDHRNHFVRTREPYIALLHTPKQVQFRYDCYNATQTNTRSNKQRVMRRSFVTCQMWEQAQVRRSLVEEHNKQHHDPRRNLPPHASMVKGKAKGQGSDPVTANDPWGNYRGRG